jgi:hypothetical protein
MDCLRALCARKQSIFDTFPRPVRGGVTGGVKENVFFGALTKKAKLQAGDERLPPASLACISMINP